MTRPSPSFTPATRYQRGGVGAGGARLEIERDVFLDDADEFLEEAVDAEGRQLLEQPLAPEGRGGPAHELLRRLVDHGEAKVPQFSGGVADSLVNDDAVERAVDDGVEAFAALAQLHLGFFAFGDVVVDLDDGNGLARLVALEGPTAGHGDDRAVACGVDEFALPGALVEQLAADEGVRLGMNRPGAVRG